METGDNKHICRLCLDAIPAGYAENIGDKEKTILKVLLINVDLHVTENAVACSRCMKKVLSGFEFKSACLHVDNCISIFVDANSPVDIKEVFRGEMRDMAMANINLENKQICRLCMSLIADEALDCNADLRDIIANCLPEVDIHTVHEPLVCELCFSRMKKFNEFMETCQEVEQRINSYLQAGVDHAIPVSVNLNDVLKFTDSSIGRLIKEESSNFGTNVPQHLKKEDIASIESEEIHIKTELDSGDEMGDSVSSGACDNSGSSGSLKRKRKIRQFTKKERKHFSSDGHMARDEDKKFACQECAYKTHAKRNLTRHMIIHKDKSKVEMHKCEHCEYETKYKSNMNKHVLRHRDPKPGRVFKCDKCPYETDIKSKLCLHNVRWHKDKSEMEMRKCENCEFETMYERSMYNHMLKHRKFKCDKCPYETNYKSNLRGHNLKHKDKSEVEMHKCENCEYETKYKSHMNRHTLKHRDPEEERKFKCNKCPYETNDKSNLGRHNLRHKDKIEVEMLKCYNCEYETRYKYDMKKHMMIHRDPKSEKKLKCDKCPYETDRTDHLSQHNLIHKNKSEVEMHKCEKCEYETKRKSCMTRHMRNHRDPKAERKYKCDKCPYETNHVYNLCGHNLIHKNKSEVEIHNCENCEFETMYKSSMVHHMRRKHRNPMAERKFKCEMSI